MQDAPPRHPDHQLQHAEHHADARHRGPDIRRDAALARDDPPTSFTSSSTSFTPTGEHPAPRWATSFGFLRAARVPSRPSAAPDPRVERLAGMTTHAPRTYLRQFFGRSGPSRSSAAALKPYPLEHGTAHRLCGSFSRPGPAIEATIRIRYPTRTLRTRLRPLPAPLRRARQMPLFPRGRSWAMRWYRAALRRQLGQHAMAGPTKIRPCPQTLEAAGRHRCVSREPGGCGCDRCGRAGLVPARAAVDRRHAPLLPTRVHVFFRNVQGVWACTNPACSGAHENRADIPVGRLFDRPTTTCPCGSRVLEMLYCEPCGDSSWAATGANWAERLVRSSQTIPISKRRRTIRPTIGTIRTTPSTGPHGRPQRSPARKTTLGYRKACGANGDGPSTTTGREKSSLHARAASTHRLALLRSCNPIRSRCLLQQLWPRSRRKTTGLRSAQGARPIGANWRALRRSALSAPVFKRPLRC